MHEQTDLTARRLSQVIVSAIAAAGLLLMAVPVTALPQAPPASLAQGQTPAPKKAEPAKKETKKAATRPARRRSRSQRQLRDPFQSISGAGGAAPGVPTGQKLPPGKRGLIIAQIVVGGIVLGGRGKIAVLTVQGRDRAYFAREGDRLYNGVVKEIRGDRVIFRERSRDVFGRVVVRDVVKRLTSSAIGSSRR